MDEKPLTRRSVFVVWRWSMWTRMPLWAWCLALALSIALYLLSLAPAVYLARSRFDTSSKIAGLIHAFYAPAVVCLGLSDAYLTIYKWEFDLLDPDREYH